MADKDRREVILDTVSDLVAGFLYYDRKEDEELSADDIEEAVEKEEIDIDEIVDHFRAKLMEGLGYEDVEDEEADEGSPNESNARETE